MKYWVVLCEYMLGTGGLMFGRWIEVGWGCHGVKGGRELGLVMW